MGVFGFFKSFIKNPREMGAIAPSSKFLARAMTQQAVGPIIVEIGAGTGALTHELVKKFLPHNLYVIEIHLNMVMQLKRDFSGTNVIMGDATNLPQILPPELVGHVSTVVSGIPLLNLTEEDRKSVIDSCFAVLNKEGCVLQFTYGPLCPVPLKKWNLYGKRVQYVMANTPPASVWKFSKTPILRG